MVTDLWEIRGQGSVFRFMEKERLSHLIDVEDRLSIIKHFRKGTVVYGSTDRSGDHFQEADQRTAYQCIQGDQ